MVDDTDVCEAALKWGTGTDQFLEVPGELEWLVSGDGGVRGTCNIDYGVAVCCFVGMVPSSKY